MDFTESQAQAINEIDKNLLIIACAGSGKTEVISRRIVNILKNQKAKPSEIVAFTFTEKAAAELKNRVNKIALEEKIEMMGFAEMFIGTIHAWCLRILQDYLYKYQKYSVLDEIKLRLFLQRMRKDNGMSDLGLDPYKNQELKLFISLISILRESELSQHSSTEPLRAAVAKYENALHSRAYFDFSMVMTEVLQSLRTNEGLQAKLKSGLKYLIVDEYQDVNPIQEDIVQSLYTFGANICVVGDDDQTIYQWRGSQIENILNFATKYQNVRSIKLEDNFRSSKAVVDLALRTIKNNQKRLADKKMNPAGDQVYERGDILCNTYADRDEEDFAVIEHVRKLRGTQYEHKGENRGLDYSDFCILLRTWSRADSIIEKLKATEIPFIVTGVNNLFETAEVKAAMQIFHFLAGNIDASLLREEWKTAGFKIPEEKWKAALTYLEKQIPKSKTFYADFCIQEIYQTFLEKADIREDNTSIGAIGESTYEYSRSEVVFYNLGMLSNVIDDYETINFSRPPQNKLHRFLGFVKYAADDFYPEGWLTNTYKTPNAVQIMTVFQAKGLEFPVVFIPGLNKNYLPIKPPGGQSVWGFLSKTMAIDPNVVKDYERYKGGIEDERRLFYVAITRAEKFLFLSRAPVTGNQLYQKESQFLAEIADSEYLFSSRERSYDDRPKSKPAPRNLTSNIFLNFSILKDFFECPYRFKLTTLYGFSQPLNVRVGYGKSLHDILMEIHREVLEGKDIQKTDLNAIVARHFHLPHAHTEVREDMTKKAERITERYFEEKSPDFKHIEFAEKDIELNLGNGIIVNGRIDLVKKKMTDGTIETTIIDFKSKEDVQTTNISMEQLSLYALGFQTLTGEKADFLEIYNMDAVDDPTKRASHREELRPERLVNTRELIVGAAGKMRANEYEKTTDASHCSECYKKLLCSGAKQ